MTRIEAQPGEIAAAGLSIEQGAGSLDSVGIAVGRMAEVSEPLGTAGALEGLTARWARGLARLIEDVEALGRGTRAASTLYTDTDERAMGPG